MSKAHPPGCSYLVSMLTFGSCAMHSRFRCILQRIMRRNCDLASLSVRTCTHHLPAMPCFKWCVKSRTLPKTPNILSHPSAARSLGRALQQKFCTLCGSTFSPEFLLAPVAKRPPGGREGHFGLETIHWIVFAGKPAVLAHGGVSRLDSAPRVR